MASRVAQKANGEYDPELMKGVKECKKIALLNAEMTWLLYKIPEAKDRFPPALVHDLWTRTTGHGTSSTSFWSGKISGWTFV